MLALQFATATANLASQNTFLFLATHGPIFIASSSSAATPVWTGRRWIFFPFLRGTLGTQLPGAGASVRLGSMSGQEQFVDSWPAPETPVALESPTRALSGLWALWVPPEFQTLGSS